MQKTSKLNPSVSLIVLNFNGKDLLKEYFTSVFLQTYIPQEVILFDNASADRSCEYVRKHFPGVIIIKNFRNDGTALASNLAVKHANGKYVILQSNDLRLQRDCLKNLVETVENKHVDICTSVFLNYFPVGKREPLIVQNAGGDIDRFGFNWPRYYDERVQKLPKIGRVFATYGSSFIMRRSVFKKLAGFDAKFFTLNDDIDLSWRAQMLGYKIACSRDSMVFHKGHATLGPLFARRTKRYWSERNVLRTLIKNYSMISLVKYLPMYFLLLLVEFFYHLITLKFGLAFAVVKAVLWNIVYLPDTVRERIKIQKIRRVPDSEIIKLMYPSSFKFRFIKI